MRAVAIPYVIALILGVVVVSLIGYWFVAQGGKTVGAGTKAECDAKIQIYCQKWKNEFLFGDRPPAEDSSCTMPSTIIPCLERLGCTQTAGSCPAGKVCYRGAGGFCTGNDCRFAC